MKKITSAVLGFTFALATAGISLAAQDAKPATNDTNTTAPTGKKHVKKHKKASKDSSDKMATPSTAAPTK